MGIDEEEIEDHIENDPPVDANEEQLQIEAAEGIRALNDAYTDRAGVDLAPPRRSIGHRAGPDMGGRVGVSGGTV